MSTENLESKPAAGLPGWLGWAVSAVLLAAVAFLLGRQWDADTRRKPEVAMASVSPVVAPQSAPLPPVSLPPPSAPVPLAAPPRAEAPASPPTPAPAREVAPPPPLQPKPIEPASATLQQAKPEPLATAAALVKQQELETLKAGFAAAAKGVGGVTFAGTQYPRSRAVQRRFAQRWLAELETNRARYVALSAELDPSADKARLDKELDELKKTLQESIAFGD